MPAGDDSGVRTTMAYGTSAVVVRSTHRACGARRRCDGAPALRMRTTIGTVDAIDDRLRMRFGAARVLSHRLRTRTPAVRALAATLSASACSSQRCR
jgi:hypothetical protein